MPNKNLIEEYKCKMCINCVGECEKGIVVFTQNYLVCNEIKQITCAKCVNYKRKEDNNRKV